MIMLVLMLTVFHVKDPVIKMKNVKIQGFDALARPNNLGQAVNLTVEADVSVKNPNVASFKFSNTTLSLYYDGNVIGEAQIAAGEARGRRTVDKNFRIDVKILISPRLKSDLASGVLSISTYTKISGKVKIMNTIKKHVVVQMNCTMTLNTRSQAIQDQNCKRKTSL